MKRIGILALVVGAVVLIAFILIIFVFPKDKIDLNLNNQGSSDSPPVLIQNIGINFEDFEFTDKPVSFNRLFFDYGFFIPENSDGPGKYNPQPTFILPLGTKVHSLIDGVVVGIPKLYSGDYSVMVAPDKESNWAYETEHVINVVVKTGDRVRAGQVVAEVSDFDAHNYGGLGLVEIGILKGGNPPSHICPFKYLDPTTKREVEAKILDFYKSWEDFKDDTSIYNESAYVSPGCLTHDEIEG